MTRLISNNCLMVLQIIKNYPSLSQSQNLDSELTIIRQVEKPLLVNACRELFRLSLKQLQNSEIFLGSKESKIFNLNLTALEKEKHLLAGKIFAISIIHGGPRPNFVSKTVFNYLANGSGYPMLEDLQNTPFHKAICDITASETIESFQKFISSHDKLLDLGVSPASFENKDKLIKEIIHYLVIDRPRRGLEQFAEGLKMLSVLSLIMKYPEQASSLFCFKKETHLTAKYLNRLFCVKRSSVGTQRRLLESQTTAFWRDYLQNCEDGDCQVSLSDVLAFATGCNTEPALGFDQQPTIEFLHDDPSLFPKSNTCALILYLPIVASDDYEMYKNNLTFGILNGLATFELP
ncbi:unnamed protein product [Brassicogethes aeneus]|uniref:HECT domain-containing protein n=1 Tax=Brassicogethes aeneus TaxID=1431903 RepID=A0A9P0FFJ4_BRAAE|nr:unnamed protein product [Brassicogethes aeneus]